MTVFCLFKSYRIFPIKVFLFFFLFAAHEFLFQDQWGGISLVNVTNLSETVLMSNVTFVS